MYPGTTVVLLATAEAIADGTILEVLEGELPAASDWWNRPALDRRGLLLFPHAVLITQSSRLTRY